MRLDNYNLKSNEFKVITTLEDLRILKDIIEKTQIHTYINDEGVEELNTPIITIEGELRDIINYYQDK